MLLELKKAIEQSIVESLDDRVGIAFSGGVDSSLLATVAKRYCDVYLATAGTPGSQDLQYAELVAKELGLPWQPIVLDERKTLECYERVYRVFPHGFLKVEIGVPLYAVCEYFAKKGIKVVLFGAGTEELFVGYDRYYRYYEEGKDLDAILREEFSTLKDRDIAMVKRIAYSLGLEARFPFYNKKIADIVFSVPLEERMADRERKKGLLREVAAFLGVPKIAVERRKKAAQYGAGVHKVLIKHSRELNERFPQSIE